MANSSMACYGGGGDFFCHGWGFLEEISFEGTSLFPKSQQAGMHACVRWINPTPDALSLQCHTHSHRFDSHCMPMPARLTVDGK